MPETPPAPAEVGALAFERRPLTPESLRAVARGLAARAEALRRVPASTILAALDATHRAWAAAESPLRAEAVRRLRAATGYPEGALDAALRNSFASMDARELRRWLAAAGIAPTDLEAEPPGPKLVFGPRLTVVVSSGNVPGAALPSIVQALLLKSPCLVKMSSREPALLPLYARSLAERCPEAAQALAVTGWDGGRADLEAAVLETAEAVVAYGSNAALEALRARLPLHARWIGYGHRISFAAVGREWLTRRRAAEAARRLARDLAVFDQQGCLSPQAVYVEEGGEVSPAGFGERLACALQAAEAELPPRRLSPAEAAAIHRYRTAVEMRALADPALHLWTSPGGTRWTVALERSPELEPCCLNRTAVLRPLSALEALPGLLAPMRNLLVSATLAVGRARGRRLAAALAEAGVTRIAPLGRAQEPASALFHDGVNAIPMLARYAVREAL